MELVSNSYNEGIITLQYAISSRPLLIVHCFKVMQVCQSFASLNLELM